MDSNFSVIFDRIYRITRITFGRFPEENGQIPSPAANENFTMLCRMFKQFLVMIIPAISIVNFRRQADLCAFGALVRINFIRKLILNKKYPANPVNPV